MGEKKTTLIKLVIIESIGSIVFNVVLNFLWPSLILFFGYSIIHGISTASYNKILSSHLVFVCVNFIFLSVCSCIKIIITPGSSFVEPFGIAMVFSIILTVLSLIFAVISKFIVGRQIKNNQP